MKKKTAAKKTVRVRFKRRAGSPGEFEAVVGQEMNLPLERARYLQDVLDVLEILD